MKVTRTLLAQPTFLGRRNNILRPAPLALLPPLPLYRRVLRAHRKLPMEHRILGDMYVKSEFKQHKSVENPIHIVRNPGIMMKHKARLLDADGCIGRLPNRMATLCADA
jgi:hypothetical protein